MNGRHEEAEREFEAAVRLDPKLFEAYYFHARASLTGGNFARAAEMFERAMEVRPEDYQAAGILPQVYVSLGRPADADAAARRAVKRIERHLELQPHDARALYFGAARLARLGETERADAWAKRALAADPDDPAVWYNVCCAYATMGKIEEALDLLEQCAKVGFHKGAWVEHDSDLDPLRSHPRYQAVLAQFLTRKGHA